MRRSRRPFAGLQILMVLCVLAALLGAPRGLSGPAVGLTLMFVAPVILFFAVVRALAHGARQIEEVWRQRLSGERSPAEYDAQYSSDRKIKDVRAEVAPPPRPDSLAGDERLGSLWDQAWKLQQQDPEIHRPARSVMQQTHALADLYERFQTLLKNKLNPDELTFQRFQSSAREGYELIVSELQEALRRIEHLRDVELSLRPTADASAFSPESVSQIRGEQLTKVDGLLRQTQDAILQLARVDLSISEMKGISTRKAGDINQAIDQLKGVAQRAKQF